jgi:uncharacterized protein
MKYVYRYPLLIILLVLGLTGFLGWQIPNMTVDNSLKNFLMDKHPAKQKSKKLEAIYGNNDVIMIVMQVKGGTIFTLDAMHKLDQVTRAVEGIQYVDDVTSIMNTEYMEGMDGGIAVDKIVPKLPVTQEDILRIKEKLFSWDLFQGFLYSDDLQATQLIVTLVTQRLHEVEVTDAQGKKSVQSKMVATSGDEEKQAFTEIQKVLKKLEDDRTFFWVVGNEAVSMLVSQGIKEDMLRLVPFVLIATLIILFFAFHSVSGVVLTTLTVIVSCLWTMGLMPLFHVDFAVMSSAIPVLLVAIGSAYGIHLISHYYDELAEYKRKHGAIGSEENREVVYSTVRKIGVPIFLAGVTTMAGFGSLMTSSILMVRNFGMFTAIGVAMALIATLTLIPALLLMQKDPLRHIGAKLADGEETLATRMLMAVYHFFTKRAVRVIVLAVVVVVLAIVGIQKIIIGQEIVNYFKPNTDIRQADKYSNEHFNGSTIMYLHVEGKPVEGGSQLPDRSAEVVEDDFAVEEDDFAVEEDKGTVSNDDFDVEDDFAIPDEPAAQAPAPQPKKLLKSLKEPDILKAMDTMGKYLKHKYPEVKQVLSIADMIKRMNKVIHVDDETPAAAQEKMSKKIDPKGETFNEIPYDPAKYGKKDKAGLRRLISQYLVLYSGNLDDFINNMDHPTSARMTIQMNNGHPQFIKRLKNDILEYAKKHVEPLGYALETVGMAEITLAVNEYVIKTQITSILLSLLFVLVVLAIYVRSFWAGLMGILPLAICLLINFGVMGFFNIPLEIGTALVASVSIGIGIDYSIHFISGYYRERKQNADLEQVTQKTMVTTGKAILFNAVSVAVGFAILLFSAFSPLRFLGILVSITMLTSSFASMTLLPVMLNLFKPKVRLS